MFPAGKKDGEHSDYDGGRTSNDIVTWALDKVADSIPAPELIQVKHHLFKMNQQAFKTNHEANHEC